MNSEVKPERLFLALWPDDEVRQAMAALQSQLQAAGVGTRATKVENLHLTLAFLGDKTLAEIEQLLAALDGISVSAPVLELQRVGIWRRNRIIYLAPLESGQALMALIENLRLRLMVLNLASTLDRFRPHITLFRGLGLARNNWLDIQCITWRASRLALVRSCLTPQGAEYELLHQWELT